MKNTKNRHNSLMMLMLVSVITLFTSCDAHKDFPDTAMKVGHVVCTDGSVHSQTEAKALNKQPIAVVFHVNTDGNAECNGYAVYIRELDKLSFSDSLGIIQGTSTSLTALDGNTNTFSLYDTKDANSPIALAVFEMSGGPSGYIPSVAQMRLLYNAKNIVNPVLESCGGSVIPDSPEDCWFWTSTEVSGMEKSKAWLYSLESGAIQETSKLQSYKSRPIITLNR